MYKTFKKSVYSTPSWETWEVSKNKEMLSRDKIKKSNRGVRCKRSYANVVSFKKSRLLSIKKKTIRIFEKKIITAIRSRDLTVILFSICTFLKKPKRNSYTLINHKIYQSIFIDSIKEIFDVVNFEIISYRNYRM